MITGTYLLNNVMGQVKTSPMTEFASNDLVEFEVPPFATAGFEKEFLNVVNCIHSQGPQVAVIVQPSLRKTKPQCLWVSKWNALENIPFKFKQTCSCKMGDPVPGCHFMCYVGTTYEFLCETCQEVPTPTACPETLGRSLGGMLATLASFPDKYSSSISPTSVDITATVRSHSRLSDGSQRNISDRLQRTPDSLNKRESLNLKDSLNKKTSQESPQQAFPTDAKERERERRKAQKEAGHEHVVKKKKKIVEDHFDDCGDDLSFHL